jgi:glutaredoxin
MTRSAQFYHGGCPVCVSAEQSLIASLNPKECKVEIINIRNKPAQIAAAKEAGVKSIPALVLDGAVFHINFGANISEIS